MICFAVIASVWDSDGGNPFDIRTGTSGRRGWPPRKNASPDFAAELFESPTIVRIAGVSSDGSDGVHQPESRALAASGEPLQNNM